MGEANRRGNQEARIAQAIEAQKIQRVQRQKRQEQLEIARLEIEANRPPAERRRRSHARLMMAAMSGIILTQPPEDK